LMLDKADGKNPHELVETSGLVERIIFQSEQTGYTVCDLSDESGELLTLVGVMPFLTEGETIKAMGRWEVHSSYGRQFKVEYYEKELPSSIPAILKYLSSRAVRGIGPVTAERIVEKFGEDTFDVIENHPEMLADIQGISRKKAEEISETFRAQFGIRSVMMFCRDFVGPSAAVKIYQRWGGSAIDMIRANPYVLCDEIPGVGFVKADRIARSIGYAADSPDRLCAGIAYILRYNAETNGHVFLPEDKLIDVASRQLGADSEKVRAAMESLAADGRVARADVAGKSCIYLKYYHDAEHFIAKRLCDLDRFCTPLDTSDIDRHIGQLELEFDIKYAAQQRKAISAAMTHGVMVLTGGPGTGKTTVIRAVLTVFDRIGYEIALAAPTGRAAKRMSEATSREAKTVHRLLEMDFSDDDMPVFKRDEQTRLDEDVIIIDEVSMMDCLLMDALCKAIKPGARLILIGDSDQLPSVGAGNVLCDIIESGRFATVKLTEIFRQAGESLIVTNAHAINRGEYPNLESNRSDFFFLHRERDDEIARTIAELCAVRLPRRYGEEIRAGIQVITPSHKGAAGTAALNALLQSTLNPQAQGKREKKVRDVVFREGDRVMQVRNNYNIAWEKDSTSGIGIFNGDTGIIESIDFAGECLTVNFDERIAVYDFTMLDELEHAYAITIHKSQGSEYPVVIIPSYGAAPQLLTRNLLYTAVTRAQEMVIIVGRPDIVSAMIDNNRLAKRYTGLKYLLEAGVQL
jgi:exodeoxyribonuclease V alpha subunit